MLLVLLGLALSAAPPAPVPGADFQQLAAQATAVVDTDPQAAVSLYQRALKLNPQWAEGWFYLGAREYQLKHVRESRLAFGQATQLAPTNGPAWAFLGMAEYAATDYPAALEHLKQGVALGLKGDPRFSSAVHTQLANLLCKRGDFGGALTQLEPLAERGDQSDQVVVAYGLSVLQRQLLPGQVSARQRPLLLEAGHAAWSMYAKQPERGVQQLKALADHYPTESGVHYAYAMALLLSDPDAALAQLRQEIKISPKHANAAVQASLLELKCGDTPGVSEAVRLARVGIESAPQYSLAHAALGRALLKQGDKPAGIEELEKAVQLDPKVAQYHFYLSQAYAQAGRTGEAQQQKEEFRKWNATGARADKVSGLADGQMP